MIMLSYLILGGLVVYLALVRSLRYRRLKQIMKKHGATPTQFSNLNYKDAQSIVGQLGIYECPWMFLAGKDFAFLRVSNFLALLISTSADNHTWARPLPSPAYPTSRSGPERWLNALESVTLTQRYLWESFSSTTSTASVPVWPLTA